MDRSLFYFGNFCLDPLARELNRNGETIVIAAAAFDCLVYLIKHRERPVGKQELISAVWGSGDWSDNVLAQTILRLRRALDEAGQEESCIKTFPRLGYRWMLETHSVVLNAARHAPKQALGNEVTASTLGEIPRHRKRIVLALLGFFGLSDSSKRK